MDDGFPQSGTLQALYVNENADYGGAMIYAGVVIGSAQDNGGQPFTTATAGSSTSCFDNGNSAGKAQQYSTEQNGGAGINCALSLRFQ